MLHVARLKKGLSTTHPLRTDELRVIKAWLAGPWVIVGLLLYDRVFKVGIFSKYLNPLVAAVFNFIKG